ARRARSTPYGRRSAERPEHEYPNREEMQLLEFEIAQQNADELLNELSRVTLASGGGEDACHSTWKDDKTGSNAIATLWAWRGSAKDSYHLDCASFHERFNDSTDSAEPPGFFGWIIPERQVPDYDWYMSKYYVNLKHFMSRTKLTGGLTCRQQLDRMIRDENGVYSLASGVAETISSIGAGRWEFWSFDN
ncbi:hypothetical protein FOZ62_003303, partial [Perkinsus olseni]